jgi:Icc protein
MPELSRRDLLLGAGASALAGALAMPGVDEPIYRGPRKRVLRFAHLTDMHVQPEKRAPIGLGYAFDHANTLRDKPDMIFTGGDLIMDALASDEDRVSTQWELFGKAVKEFNRLPLKHCLGNHDAFPGDPKTGGDIKQAKKRACDELGLDSPYYAFDHANWRIVVLDSTFLTGGSGYTAKLDAEQMEWLRGELVTTPKEKHIMVVSHIPILTVTSFLFSESEKSGNWQVPGAWMHTDARVIKNIFHRAGNVRLCISGHMHLVDRCDYLGTTYLCHGAVCGNWWNGAHQECNPGYAVVNLYSDGTFDHEYVEYGWPR